jgi:hypothetical protein
MYRLAAWRRPPAVGTGRLAVHVHGRGLARLRYRGADGAERASCIGRQLWALRVVAFSGASRATLREEACLAAGDTACEYVVTWRDHARALPVAAAGLVAAVALGWGPLPRGAPVVWLAVPAVAAAMYAVERWRASRTGPVASAQSGAAFRSLVTGALAGRTEPVSGTTERQHGGVLLEQHGDIWQAGYQGTTITLRHSRGLALLAHLVRNPGQEVHVSALDAITPSGGSATARNAPAPDGGIMPARGDGGEILDAQARAEYRRRATELREELEEAEACHDAGRVEAMRAELELLEEELRLALGAGGRPRRAANDAERLRVAITHRIRAAIGQLARRHPALGTHLTATVSTGYRCVYDPAGAQVADGPATRQRERKA